MGWGGSNITTSIKTISQQQGTALTEEEIAAMSPSQRNSYLSKISRAANSRFATNQPAAHSTSHARYNTQN
jgi:hypothetical protein